MTAVGSRGSTFGGVESPYFLEAWLVCVTRQEKFK